MLDFHTGVVCIIYVFLIFMLISSIFINITINNQSLRHLICLFQTYLIFLMLLAILYYVSYFVKFTFLKNTCYTTINHNYSVTVFDDLNTTIYSNSHTESCFEQPCYIEAGQIFPLYIHYKIHICYLSLMLYVWVSITYLITKYTKWFLS